MPTISRIRLTNVIYENNAKRYNDQIFRFDGENGIFLLENGGGKTVFLQTVLQAVIPHADMAERKIKDTLVLDGSPAHIAIEWILNEKPRRYALTAVSLFMENNVLKSYKYVYSYGVEDKNSIDSLPFVVKNKNFRERAADKGEISEYYSKMKQQHIKAEVFTNRKDYHHYIQENFKIVPSEWYKIAMINSSEGAIEAFFNHCKTTDQLVNNLLIPTVEDALQGNQKMNFAQTFEKQREHFKQNKRLLEEIEQFKSIKEKVDIYVQEYSKLHISGKEYDKVRMDAKAFNKYILEMIDIEDIEKINIEQEQQVYEDDKNCYDHKLKSLDILDLDQERNRLKSQLNEFKKEHSDTTQYLKETDMRIQNIEISQLSNKQDLHNQKIMSLKEQLSTVEQSIEETEIRSKIDETMSYIHGVYLDMLEKYGKEKDSVIAQSDREKESLGRLKKQMHSKNQIISDTELEKKGLETEVLGNEKRMEQIKTEVYETFSESNSQDYLLKLKGKIKNIEEDLQKSRVRLKEVKMCQEQMDKKIVSHQRNEVKLSEKKIELNTLVNQMIQKQESLIAELEINFFNLNIFDTIYTKEPTIRQSLRDRLEKLNRDFEDALTIERVHSRLADMYGEQPFFAADTYLMKKLRSVSNQVTYVEHGVMYLQNNIHAMGQDINQLFLKYPYWANTIVTTDKEKQKVIKYIKSLQKELTYPVLVVTTTMVQELIKNNGMSNAFVDNTVFPNTWKENLNTDAFNSWKEVIIMGAGEAKAKRLEINEKLQKMRSLNEKVQGYFSDYSYEYYLSKQEEIKLLEGELSALRRSMDDISKEKERLSAESEKINNHINEINEEKPEVAKRIDLINEFIKLSQHKLDKNVKIQELSELLLKYSSESNRLKQELTRQEEILDEVKETLLNLQYTILSIESDELYLKSKDTEFAYSNKDIRILKEDLYTLEVRLHGFEGKAREINLQIDAEKKAFEDVKTRLERKKLNAIYSIELIDVYHPDELVSLETKSKRLAQEQDELQTNINHVDKQLAQLNGKREEKYKPIERIFGGLYQFKEDILTAKQQIEADKLNLEKRKKDLDKRKEKNMSKLKLLITTKHDLELVDAKHQFASITLSNYNKNDFINFEYDKHKVLIRLKQNLEKKELTYRQIRNHIESKRNEYLDFCRDTIKEPKLRETALTGINKNQNYEELLNYQKRMEDILNRSITLAEDDRRESDAELQTFLSHLLTYSKNVINEINDIQYKTKIKVDGTQKQIFIFIIPKWDELEAKEELRKYINRLVADYDKENEHLLEDKEAMRQYIEKKLSVKNLILRMMGDKSIKIKCRKVTNDLKVNQAPMTWESSNKWSGGEKWSKNMTLFLSILNYLAEKKQYMSPSQKRHRTVILDNPFGKASSKHVLDPVFFVAENLGFQMITVTAHAEGQFVTDYFPIVYSGKLRPSSEPDKHIIEITKTLNTVYLKLESPDSLMRFEESEQLSFLETE